MWRSHILFYFRRFILFLSRSVIASRFSSTGPSSEKLLSIRATASRAKLMCWAICSWVCCSKSTSRMTSYSSGVSRIGSVFSPPRWGKMSRLVVRHKSDGTVAVLAWTLFSFCFQYIPNYSTLCRKKQYSFQKLLQFPSSYRCWLIFGVKSYI